MKLFLKLISALSLTILSSNIVVSCSSNSNNKISVETLMSEFNTTFITKDTTKDEIRNDIKKYLLIKTNIDESIINTDKGFFYGMIQENTFDKKIYVGTINTSFDFKYYGSWTKTLLPIDINKDDLDLEMKQNEEKEILIKNAEKLKNIKIEVDNPNIISIKLNNKSSIILKANKQEGNAKITVQADNGLLETIKIKTTIKK